MTSKSMNPHETSICFEKDNKVLALLPYPLCRINNLPLLVPQIYIFVYM